MLLVPRLLRVATSGIYTLCNSSEDPPHRPDGCFYQPLASAVAQACSLITRLGQTSLRADWFLVQVFKRDCVLVVTPRAER